MKTVTACPAPRVTLAWECPHCGERHLWKWRPYDVTTVGSYLMRCEFCKSKTDMPIVQIGQSSWAGVWKK